LEADTARCILCRFLIGHALIGDQAGGDVEELGNQQWV
jgi:hypothetical protein